MNILTLAAISLILTFTAPFILLKFFDEYGFLTFISMCILGLATMIFLAIAGGVENGSITYPPYEINQYEVTGEYTLSASRWTTDICYGYIKDGEGIKASDDVQKIAFTDGASYVIERKYNIFGIEASATDLYINEDEYKQVAIDYARGINYVQGVNNEESS